MKTFALPAMLLLFPAICLAQAGTHKVIYKVGEYPYRPAWMTQKQWDTYIDWESGSIHKQDAPRRSLQDQISRRLTIAFGHRFANLTLVDGQGPHSAVPGKVAMVDMYAKNNSEARMLSGAAAELIFDVYPSVSRVLASGERQDQTTIYCFQQDRGQRRYVLTENGTN